MAEIDKQSMIDCMMNHLESNLKTLSEELKQMNSEGSSQGKSSAGDKHEVSGTMLSAEINRIEGSVVNLDRQLKEIQEIRIGSGAEVGQGSVLETNNGIFFISASFGKFQLGDLEWFAISRKSPLALSFQEFGRIGEMPFRDIKYQIKGIS